VGPNPARIGRFLARAATFCFPRHSKGAGPAVIVDCVAWDARKRAIGGPLHELFAPGATARLILARGAKNRRETVDPALCVEAAALDG